VRGGSLNRKICIQRKSNTLTASGFPQEVWVDLAFSYWASYEPVKGDERLDAPQAVAKQQVLFRIRKTSSFEPGPLDRIVFPCPATEDEQTPAESAVFDIIEVREFDRRKGWEIIAFRRADVA
jgi:hypothetical protein